MSDDEPAAGPSERDGTRGERNANVFERLFPGPAPKDARVAAGLEALARAAERRAAQESLARTRFPGRPRFDGAEGRADPAFPPSPGVLTADDLDTVIEALHEQTEVMRALLEADAAIRDDARATAQNSRTFAIAGTFIALLTLVATVVTVVLAVTG